MRSVNSIGKITKAMKMVAAAKLKGVQRVQEKARPFGVGMDTFFSGMNALEVPPASDGAEKPKELLVAVNSDRGLCGGVNGNVVKMVMKQIDAKGQHEGLKILLVGDKGRDALTRRAGNHIITSFKDVFRAPITFDQASVIAEEIMKDEYNRITIVYNKFRSVISQEVTAGVVPGLEFMTSHAEVFDKYEFEAEVNSEEVLVDLFELKLASQLYAACLENGTSEQAARMSAMDNASRNARDMLGKLTLNYNRQRQANITQELGEIVAGSEALK
ncbi:ATP synthase gamma chain [Porphyridium purpureum]|uniref:ATP synthase subunit gamma n=1 Tax=Porphyridium purpureum TaxID=35688 RepID=A0A5J4Z9P3_PORPP|nr:ATP synthase gamma chain [Porphyridium purpureum]|eukprot:POR0287..scf295_1